MGDIIIARRAILGLLAASVSAAGPRAAALAQPAGKHRPPLRRPSHPRHPVRPRPLRAIAIDPGHGGIDPGAVGPDGLYEKAITLATAVELARQLDATGRFRAVLTRDRDAFVPLRERVARARAHRVELFLSIHADALPDSTLRGLSVYTLSDQASDREAALLAIRENKENFVGGVKLSREPPVIGSILLDLARRQTNNSSLVLARAVVSELGRMVPLLEKPHRAAGFAVLTAPDVPSVLVELGCLSNPREEHLLQEPRYRRLLVQGLLRAIDDYFAAYTAA